ncbi:MAG: glucose 1-dehydrogenase [Firmicutes bacterium]|nr:glucose 1-dehydrogenase [Bacillota bacterium]
MNRLTGQVALVTGAGSGMGRVVASMFAQEGANVIAFDISESALAETQRLVEAEGGTIEAVVGDVANEGDVQAAVDRALARFGRLSVLYNNAGIMPEEDHSVVDTSVSVWDQVQAVNVRGIYLVCKHGIPALIANGGGSIINIASFVAFVGCTVPQDAYTASKGAVIALTKSLAAQFGRHRVRANAICPGPIETPLLTDWLLTNPEAKALRLNRIPLGRFGRPEDVGYLAVYLASDESSWMTGASLNIDGGITSYYF